MKKISALIILIIPLFTIAQKQGNIWYFGNHAGIDFNTTPPAPLLNSQIYILSPYGWNEGCSSISDSSGSLLFYSNGEKIWNRNQQVMPNGNNLMGHRSSTQSCIIVPQPNSSRYFYVFTTDASEHNFLFGLRYSVVDMCLEKGIGDVITYKKNILLLDTANEKLICIRHSNGTDYWIIAHLNNDDAFYSFRLNSTGIVDTVISHTGTVDANTTNATGGQIVASPNGLMISYAKPSLVNGLTLLFDFDPSTGIVSNERTLASPARDYGTAFSPDNSKLYFSTDGIGEIFQYDLNAGNFAALLASKTYILQNGPDSWRDMKLGPDNKIYLSRAGKTFLSRIDYPNNLGLACHYVDTALNLGGKLTSFGLPNFIAGYDYSNNMTICPEGIDEESYSDNISIYPNPFSSQLTLSFLEEQINSIIIIIDILGEEIKKISFNGKVCLVDKGDIKSGIYFVRITDDKRNIMTRKIVIQ
jgi:hypothetical protein